MDVCETCGRSDSDCVIEEVPEMKLAGRINTAIDTFDGSIF